MTHGPNGIESNGTNKIVRKKRRQFFIDFSTIEFN